MNNENQVPEQQTPETNVSLEKAADAPAPETPVTEQPAAETPAPEAPAAEQPAASVLEPAMPQVTRVTPPPQDRFDPNAPREIPTIPAMPPSGYIPPNPERPRFSKEVERILALPQIPKAQSEACRHRLEKPWYTRLIIINVLLIVFVLLAVAVNLHTYGEKLAELSASSGVSIFGSKEQALEEAAKIPLELQLLFYGIGMLIAIFFVVYYMLAQVRASALKITPNNFPEIYAIAQSFAYRLGMERVPDIYVAQASGVLNAFSSFIIHKQYILINSEIFETAYREHHDIDSLAFILAHEMSHIYYEHATFHYNFWILFAQQVPIVSQIASRTREYSCDRLAQMLTDWDGLDAMFMLIMDRHLYKSVDKIDYLENAVRERGFFIWLVNLLSSHPIMTKRIRALTVRSGSGELY